MLPINGTIWFLLSICGLLVRGNGAILSLFWCFRWLCLTFRFLRRWRRRKFPCHRWFSCFRSYRCWDLRWFLWVSCSRGIRCGCWTLCWFYLRWWLLLNGTWKPQVCTFIDSGWAYTSGEERVTRKENTTAGNNGNPTLIHCKPVRIIVLNV